MENVLNTETSPATETAPTLETDAEQTVVVFRKFKDLGDIVALFPNEVHTEGQCVSYMHVGQHGGATYLGCMKSSIAATPEEYAPLKAELESLGYNLKVMKRNRLPKTKTVA